MVFNQFLDGASETGCANCGADFLPPEEKALGVHVPRLEGRSDPRKPQRPDRVGLESLTYCPGCEAQMELNAQKDRFLAMMAHELRNPLAALLAAVDVLQKGPAPEASASKAVQIMNRQIRQLVHLVDELYEFARYTTGKVTLRKEAIDLRAVVDAAVETSRPLIDEREHRLVVSLPEVPLTMHADPGRLEQALVNLLHNAAKYTPNGGRIMIELTETKDGPELSVRDNGCGIARDGLTTIFDCYKQVESPEAEPHMGLGIGLALAKMFVELHGGTLAAHSDGLGRGSTFTIRLPV